MNGCRRRCSQRLFDDATCDRVWLAPAIPNPNADSDCDGNEDQSVCNDRKGQQDDHTDCVETSLVARCRRGARIRGAQRRCAASDPPVPTGSFRVVDAGAGHPDRASEPAPATNRNARAPGPNTQARARTRKVEPETWCELLAAK